MGIHNLTLKTYAKYQECVLRFYVAIGKLTKTPLLGPLIRILGNWYGKNLHKAYLLTHEEAVEIVDACNSIAVGSCSCRKVFQNCDSPIETDMVIGVGRDIFSEVEKREYRVVSKEEAREILEKCRLRGLVHRLSRCKKDFYAICNCCRCCCVPTRLARIYEIKNALVRDQYVVHKVKNSLL